MDNKELIWVEKEFAEKYKLIENDASKKEERIKIFDTYMESIKEKSKKEFMANLESLEEDVAIYNGLMLKIKQSFEKAKNEQLDASYKLWEKFEEEIPSIEKKIGEITSKLEPLEKRITRLNELLKDLQTWNIDRVVESVVKISSLDNKSKAMIEFLIKNFKTK